MKRILSLLLLLAMLFSTVSCAELLDSILKPTPSGPVTPEDPDQQKPTPPPSDNDGDSTPPTVSPTPPPVVLPGLEDAPEAVSATYHLLTDRDRYLLYALYTSADGAQYSVTREGTFTLRDGLYTLTTDTEPLYGVYRQGVFYLTDETGEASLPSLLRGGTGITEVTLAPAPGNRTEGYLDLSNRKGGANLQAFYREMKAACDAFLTDNTAVTDENFAIAELAYASLSLTKDDALSVWKIFTLENPAYYWLSSSVLTSSTHLYLCIDPSYADPSVRRTLNGKIETMIAEADAMIEEGMTDLEIALCLHDFILERINYAYVSGTKEPESAIWAHNIIGVATGMGGVCEAYAKTFHFLGTIFGLDVLTVSGYAGEPHAWNLLYLGSEWYGVDLTWDDTNESTHAYTHFGMSASVLNAEHTPDSPYATGSDYLYALPPVAETDIALVTLYKNGEKLTVCAGIDDAFLLMVDESADYRIDLFNYAFEGEFQNAYPTARHTVFSPKTPAVASITVTGGTFILDRYSEKTPIYLMNAGGFTLCTDLSIESAVLMSELPAITPLYPADHTLTFTGKTGGVSLTVLGDKTDASALTVNVEDAVYLDGFVSVGSIRIESGTLVLEGGADLASVHGASLRIAPDTETDPYDYRIDALALPTGKITLLASDYATLYLGTVEAKELHLELAFEEKDAFPSISFGTVPNAALKLFVDGNVDEDTVATPINLPVSLALFPSNMTMENIDIYFAVWSSHGGINIHRNALFEIKDDGKLQTIDYEIVQNDFVMKGDILYYYIGDDSHVTVPSTVREIYPMAFVGNDSITRITLPEGLEILQPSSFLRCANLAHIDLPATLRLFSAGFASDLSSAVEIHYNGTREELSTLLQRNNVTSVSAAFTFLCTDGTL